MTLASIVLYPVRAMRLRNRAANACFGMRGGTGLLLFFSSSELIPTERVEHVRMFLEIGELIGHLGTIGKKAIVAQPDPRGKTGIK